MSDTHSLDTLVQALRRLPGVGQRSAQRMAFHLLQHDRPGALQRGLVGRGFDHRQLGRVAPRVQAGGADFGFGEGVAQRAVPDLPHGGIQRLRQCLRARPVVLQQMKGHALGRALAHAGQAAQGLYKDVEAVGVRHQCSLPA